MTDLDRLQTALINAHQAGDTAAAAALAQELRKLSPPTPAPDPTADMSGLEKFGAGWGKAVSDMGSGLSQLVTFGDAAKKQAADIAAQHKRDEPLMNTGAGMAGNVLGNLSMMIGGGGALGAAAKALPKIPYVTSALSTLSDALMAPKNIPQAALGGGVIGATQPVGTNDSRLANTGLGVAASTALPLVLQGGSIVKSMVAPFSRSGQESATGRALERFATNPSNIINPPQAGALVPGSRPTLAEVAQDPGLSQLYRTLRNNPDANGALVEREMANNAARQSALADIAGSPGQREFYDASRQTAAEQLYQKAFGEMPNATPWVKGQITQLQKRPAFNAAWDQAQQLMAEKGMKVEIDNAPLMLHHVKLSLDDMIGSAMSAGKTSEANAIKGTRDKVLALLESKDFAPSYREARATYAEMSKPINQMDVGQALYDKFVPALSDFGANVRSRPQAFADAVRKGDETAARATGFGGAKMEQVMSPDQMATINGVGRDLGRSVNAAELGSARGSPTAQNMIGQDILRQVLGPLGLPKSFAESSLAESLLRPVSFAYKAPEKRIMGLLSEAQLDPDLAKQLYLKALLGQIPSKAERAIPYASPASVAGLLGLSQ